MNISYEGIGHVGVTFPAGTCVEGQVCKIGTDGKAAACSAGEKFCGVAETVNESCAGVQIHGFVTVAYTGTAPAMGYAAMSANGSGGVKADSNGNTYLVAAVDSAAMTVTFEL